MAIEVHGVAPLLQVYDMPRSVQFYRDVLGFEVVATSPNLGGTDRFHWALLRLGDAEIMLNTAYEFDEKRPAEPDRGRTAAHGDTGLFFACRDVQAAYEEFSAKGLVLQKPHVTGYGTKQLSLSDPDGYGLCFQWRATEQKAAGNDAHT